jgi:hypothetical protein
MNLHHEDIQIFSENKGVVMLGHPRRHTYRTPAGSASPICSQTTSQSQSTSSSSSLIESDGAVCAFRPFGSTPGPCPRIWSSGRSCGCRVFHLHPRPINASTSSRGRLVTDEMNRCADTRPHTACTHQLRRLTCGVDKLRNKRRVAGFCVSDLDVAEACGLERPASKTKEGS